MLTKEIVIKLKGPETKNLKPPVLEAHYTIEMDGDPELEGTMWSYYEKHFAKLATKKLQEQLNYIKKPLTSMQKDIDKMTAAYNKATSAKDMGTLLTQIELARDQHDQIKKALKYYQEDYIPGMVKNFEVQTLLAWGDTFQAAAEKAAKKAIGREIKWKKFRKIAGVILKTTLVVTGTAVAVMATIASFGTAPAIVAGIGAAAVGIAKLGALKKAYGDIKKAADSEKAALDNLSMDLKEIATHLGKTENRNKGLAKHLKEASKFYTQRKDLLEKTNAKVVEINAKLEEYKTKVSQLKSKVKKEPNVIKQNQKKIVELTKARDKYLQTIKTCQAKDKEMKKLFKQAGDLIGTLNKIDFGAPRSLSDMLGRYKSFDSVVSAVGALDVVSKSAGKLA
jgi:methyl-accepting chemotaxis protein